MKTSHKHIKNMNAIYPKGFYSTSSWKNWKGTFSRKAVSLISGRVMKSTQNLLRPRKPRDKLWNRDNSRYVYEKLKKL